MHGNVEARTLSSPLTQHSRSSQCLRLSSPLYISPFVSLDSRCVAWISSLQHFILSRHKIYPQFNRLRHRIARTHTHVDSARETSVCARCGFLCFSDETDQQLRAIRTLFIKLQTPSLLDYFCQERFVQTCCEISADVVVICLFT